MASLQRLILEDADTTYRVLIESAQPIQPAVARPPAVPLPPAMPFPPSAPQRDDLESYDPNPARGGISYPAIPPEVHVKLAEVHRTIQGYTQYAIGAFKNLAIAEVEAVTLKFNIKISAEGGIPMIASGKTESDFSIEVKCKFPEHKTPQET